MALYTIVAGQQHPYWTVEWKTVNANNGKSALKDFTGLVPSNFSLTLHNLQGGIPDITGIGTFVIVSSPGWIQYQPAAADVATPGQYQVFITANYGSLPDICLPFNLTIAAK